MKKLIFFSAFILLFRFVSFSQDNITTQSGLKYLVLYKGNGAKAFAGAKVKVDYTGMFTDGKVFDSSHGSAPLKFKLGAREVIPGFDEGVQLMSQGDKYRLIIPSNLGYGEKGVPDVIPPNTTLIFDIKLLKIK